MATPQFILDLRSRIGHDELWLPGVSVFVIDGDKILLVQRKDNHQWTPITGICDPHEQPDVAARRECFEETGVTIRISKLLWVRAVGPMTYSNGDQASYMDIAFLAVPESGTAHVADDENINVQWFPLAELPIMQRRFQETLAHALAGNPAGWGIAAQNESSTN